MTKLSSIRRRGGLAAVTIVAACVVQVACFVAWTRGTSASCNAVRRQAERQVSRSVAEPPVLTYMGVNTFGLAIGGRRLLVDPLLTGDLTFFGQRWAFAGGRRADAVAAAVRPFDVFDQFDAVVLTQGLEDHTHLPTLLEVDRRMQIIGSARAAEISRGLGFTRVACLVPGQSLSLGPHLRITAVPGSVVGPPWDAPENGYVFADTRQGGLAVGMEPHGNFLGPALGTSLRLLPCAPPVHVDALVIPLASQVLAGYRLVNGPQEALETLEALRPVPRFVLPLKNGEIDAIGPLADALQEQGSVIEFEGLLRQRPSLKAVNVLDVSPGRPVSIK